MRTTTRIAGLIFLLIVSECASLADRLTTTQSYNHLNGNIPGHYLIVDEAGFGDFEMIITLQINALPRKHDLVSAQSPDVKKYYQVCFDRAIGHKMIPYSQNTKRSLTLTSFPNAPEVIVGSKISGSLEVSLEL